jgi:alkane 1-monooxygenase
MIQGPISFLPIFLLTLPLIERFGHGRLGLFITPIVVLGVVPLVDVMLGRDRLNPDAESEPGLDARRGFHLVLWAAVPLQLLVTFTTLRAAATRPLGVLELVDLVLSAGLISATVGINVAHELVHRGSRTERLLGHVLLLTVGYVHWGIEHVHGHHRWVATPRDPVSARQGQTVYGFLPRAIWGEARGAWTIEARRLARLGLPALHARNRLLWGFAFEGALLVGLGVGWGAKVALVWLGAGLVAVALLQVINYVEHYGLERRQDGAGRYERVSPAHSWDSSEWLSNKLLFNLQRHADHHAHAGRPFQLLRHVEGSPQLPTGYAGMVLVALVPPLWFWIMDPRLEACRRAQPVAAAETPAPAVSPIDPTAERAF